MDTYHLARLIDEEIRPKRCATDEFYDEMESQSAFQLAEIYQPFDMGNRMHWRDEGYIFDCLYATGAKSSRILDFGPGDGWPSLPLAPHAREVVGVDGSRRRVQVCADNAERMGISNARFIHVPPGGTLPLDKDSFDAAVAASSVEQTPDPRATLTEIHRILRPGGRLRISYEALNQYRGGGEFEVRVQTQPEGRSRLTVTLRDIDAETARTYKLDTDLCPASLQELVGEDGEDAALIRDTACEVVSQLGSHIVDARVSELRHPSGETLATWLEEIGFHQVHLTHDGGDFAGRLFDSVAEDSRPTTHSELSAWLEPLVAVVVDLPAPAEIDPMVTAVK